MLTSIIPKGKSLAFYTLLSCLLAFSFSFESCTKNPCDGVICLNGGQCSNGTCQCPSGYSGTQCQNFDPCANITCYNGGTCANGLCNCPTGYSGSDCSTVLNPVSMTITSINVTNYPIVNASGGGWDLSTGADPYLAFSLGTSSSAADWITNYYNNVTGNAIYYTLTTPKVITNLSANWTLGCWDYDSPDPDNFMGGIYFTPNNYKSGFPSSFTISSASFSFTLYVTWQF